MIIEDNRKKNATRFKDLDLGDAFIFNNNLFIKIGSIDTYGYGQAWCFGQNSLYSAIDVETIIQKINAKIVIYD